jgi:hypothetical protein
MPGFRRSLPSFGRLHRSRSIARDGQLPGRGKIEEPTAELWMQLSRNNEFGGLWQAPKLPVVFAS